jgi:hypothetical protein
MVVCDALIETVGVDEAPRVTVIWSVDVHVPVVAVTVYVRVAVGVEITVAPDVVFRLVEGLQL